MSVPILLEESQFTEPNSLCPNPQYWHSMDGQSTELEVSQLVAAFVRALQPEFVVETGTAFGQTAELIGIALRDNKHGKLVTLEMDESLVEVAKKRCSGLPVDVTQINSLDWTPSQPIDFAWFDSELHVRHSEFLLYYPYFTDRTIVGFHDTGPQHPIKELIEEKLVRPGLIKPIYLPTPRGVCFAQVIKK